MKRWIKLHIEILSDPKMGRLPDATWRRAVELFMLAGETGDNGELPPVDDIAWKLRVPVDQLRGEIETLEKCGILTVEADSVTVTNFAERQAQEDSTQRVREWRRKNVTSLQCNGDVTVTSLQCNGDVTRRQDKNKNRIEENRIEENRQEQETAAALVVVVVPDDRITTAYNAEIGKITQSIEARLCDLQHTYGVDMVTRAIDEAAVRNRRNLAYISGILKNWNSVPVDHNSTAEEISREWRND